MSDMLVALRSAGFEINRDANTSSLKKVKPPLSKSMILEEYGVYSGSSVLVCDVLEELEKFVESYEEINVNFIQCSFLVKGKELKPWLFENREKVRVYKEEKNIWGIRLVFDETYRKLYVYVDKSFIRCLKEACGESVGELCRLSKIRVGEISKIEDSLFLLNLALRVCRYVPLVTREVHPVLSENKNGKMVNSYLGYNILASSEMVGKLSNWLSGHRIDSKVWYFLRCSNGEWYLRRNYKRSPKRWK